MSRPDFLIIPLIVQAHPELQPADWIVYAVVYWYEHMRDGKCIAANGSIAEVAGVGERAVRGALERLEKAGFIAREFKDKRRKERLQIRCLVRYAQVGPETTPSRDVQPVLVGIHDERPETPREYARRFFEGDKDIVGDLGEQLEAAGASRQFVIAEMLKFRNHWTELTPNGRKQKWELERTFEIKKRLGTWFRNAVKWQGARGGKMGARAGAGVEL